MRAPAGAALAVLLAACGGGEAERAVGMSSGRPDRPPVELELTSSDGELVLLGDLRGQVVVLYLFGTFDGVSQAGVRPLSRFVRHHADTTVIAVAVQPDPAALVDAWAAALEPPFVVTWEAEDTIAGGTSDLGAVDTIPTTVFLDRRGVEVARHVGFPSLRRLEDMLADASR
jgi:hypothetical protein